jgi:hypothetical protein
MAISPRRSSFPSCAFIAVIAVLALTDDVAAQTGGALRLTSAANATLRAAPSPEAPAIAQLPLGTEVREAGPAGLDKTWRLVRLGDAREGWLQTRLTKAVDPDWRSETYDAIIAERLGRKGDGFGATVELLSFIERVAPEYGDPDSRAGVALARLQALARAAAAIPFNGAKREPYGSWLGARQPELVYDEPGGRWIVRNPAIWNVHAKYRETAASDDIAWFAATTGLAGECEGFVSCYFASENTLRGDYLRTHPFGRHAADAVASVNSMLGAVWSAGEFTKPYSFDRKDDCQQLAAAVDGLVSAIQTAKAAGWESTVANLSAVRKQCP